MGCDGAPTGEESATMDSSRTEIESVESMVALFESAHTEAVFAHADAMTIEAIENHVARVAALTNRQRGQVGEKVARGWAADRGFEQLNDAHDTSHPGLDHIFVGMGALLLAETKATGKAGDMRQFSSLLGKRQGTSDWVDQDSEMRNAGLDQEMSVGLVGLRVDLATQTVHVWEQNAEGGWDHVGSESVPMTDAVRQVAQ